jgi:hypothetical protein
MKKKKEKRKKSVSFGLQGDMSRTFKEFLRYFYVTAYSVSVYNDIHDAKLV